MGQQYRNVKISKVENPSLSDLCQNFTANWAKDATWVRITCHNLSSLGEKMLRSFVNSRSNQLTKVKITKSMTIIYFFYNTPPNQL